MYILLSKNIKQTNYLIKFVIHIYIQNKMKQRIYIDTSVVGGYFDEEFSADTIAFFQQINNGEIIVILSDV